jgi:hypothetical protein
VYENKGTENKKRRVKATRLLKIKKNQRPVGKAIDTHKTVTMADVKQSGMTVR